MKGRIERTEVYQGNTLPEAGRIKIGDTIHGKTANEKEYNRPVSLDYFRATGTFAKRFHSIFGDKPTELTVVFISDDLSEVCNQRFECWDGGKRVGYGDGNDFTVWDPLSGPLKKDGTPQGSYKEVKKGDPLLSGKKWDEMLTLRFILPDMKGILGQWSFTTKGAKAIIPSLIKGFDFIKERVGTVSGIPWQFSVEKVKGYCPGESRVYSRVKLIPVITPETVDKIREYLEAGKNISSIAPLMLNEAKLNNIKYIDAPHVDITTPKKYVVEKDGTVKEIK